MNHTDNLAVQRWEAHTMPIHHFNDRDRYRDPHNDPRPMFYRGVFLGFAYMGIFAAFILSLVYHHQLVVWVEKVLP